LGYPDAELSIVIIDDERMHALNLEWRRKDRPTDVLSFPQWSAQELAALSAAQAAGPVVLGDVVISLDTASRQAEALGHTLEAEIRRLLIHGILHLLGHDHVHGGTQARRMKREERRLTLLLDAALPLPVA